MPRALPRAGGESSPIRRPLPRAGGESRSRRCRRRLRHEGPLDRRRCDRARGAALPRAARQLVDQLTADEFELEEFRDEFADRLEEMMEKKEKITVEEAPEEQPFDEDSLMEALQASLN